MTEPTLTELEEAVRRDPRNADLRHLLAAHYAQAGQYESASTEFREVLALQPAAHVARFQLGLLELTMGRPAAAIDLWAPLEALPAGAALKWFKHGLEALIQDRFAQCADCLRQGIAANQGNLPLNDDMRLILAKLPREKTGDTARDADVRTDFSLYGSARH